MKSFAPYKRQHWVFGVLLLLNTHLHHGVCQIPEQQQQRQKILLIGIDGLRADAAAMLPLPNLRRLERMGTYSYWATVQSTGSVGSGPGWTSILTGVEVTKHKVYTNYDMQNLAVPSVFRRVKLTYPDLKMAASCTWHPLITDLINAEDATTLSKSFLAPNDEQMAAKAVDWIYQDQHDFIFVHFDECDGAGHAHGFDGYVEAYSQQVEATDALVGTLLDAVEATQVQATDEVTSLVEWLIVVTTDHGGKGVNHGAQIVENRRIPLIVASNSPQVEIGRWTSDEDPGSHMDATPTILYFLNRRDGSNAFNVSEFDGQPMGLLDYTRTPPPPPATSPPCTPDPSNCGCGDQSDYRGFISTTRSGKECQEWASQSPQRHDRTPQNYPDYGLENNYCRNPDNEVSAWCYTTDPNSRWDFCDVPVCDTPPLAPTPKPCAPDPAHCGCGDQSDYRGFISTTRSGKTCQAWTSQSPQRHDRTPENYPDYGLEKNYCRNPDNEAFAWCYTTDPTARWEYCDVPVCGANEADSTSKDESSSCRCCNLNDGQFTLLAASGLSFSSFLTAFL